jgi:hypothetical protein
MSRMNAWLARRSPITAASRNARTASFQSPASSAARPELEEVAVDDELKERLASRRQPIERGLRALQPLCDLSRVPMQEAFGKKERFDLVENALQSWRKSRP